MSKQKLKLYYVEGGDTLYKIAKRFNTTEQEILKYNRPWLSSLSGGLKLWIPDNRIGTKTSSITDDMINEDKKPGEEKNQRIKASDIESIKISPSKILYNENSSPGDIAINLKTKMPTRGDIAITSNSWVELIMLSEAVFKTEHLIFWTPIHKQTKKPLLPGEYTLKFNLYKQK